MNSHNAIKDPTLSQAIAAAAVFVGLVLCVLGVLVGHKLLMIDALTEETHMVTIPRVAQQQQRALATESLAKFGAQVIVARTSQAREKIVERAMQTAQSLEQGANANEKQLVAGVIQAIRAAERNAIARDELAAKISAEIRSAEKVVKEIEGNLSSIEEDSGTDITAEIEQITALDSAALENLATDLRALFSINAASGGLLAGLYETRSLLAAGASFDDLENIGELAAQFDRTIANLQRLASQLPHTGDFEYFPELLAKLGMARQVFVLRRKALEGQTLAIEQSNNSIGVVEKLSGELATDAAAQVNQSITAIHMSARAIGVWGGAALAVLLCLAAAGGWIGRRAVIQPILASSAALDKLSRGVKDVAAPTARLRELRAISESIERFRDTLIELERRDDEKAEEDSRSREQRRQLMLQMAERFETSVKGTVVSVSEAANRMRQAAVTMADTAERTTGRSEEMATASAEAAASAKSVAVSTEELSITISQMESQASHSSNVARNAYDRAATTAKTIGRLHEAAQNIYGVINLIRDIAEQTNLLALNATIEAARAGDAGKGFAVVAAEVKTLANQTAAATSNISSEIEGIQTMVGEAVDAIGGIHAIIDEITKSSEEVATAMAQQGLATNEIAQHVQQSAMAANQTSENSTAVRGDARQTGDTAQQVLVSADDLRTLATTLQEDVDAFLKQVVNE